MRLNTKTERTTKEATNAMIAQNAIPAGLQGVVLGTYQAFFGYVCSNEVCCVLGRLERPFMKEKLLLSGLAQYIRYSNGVYNTHKAAYYCTLVFPLPSQSAGRSIAYRDYPQSMMESACLRRQEGIHARDTGASHTSLICFLVTSFPFATLD